MQEDFPPPLQEMEAREFDGTFDVKPQVYGTYDNQDDYPQSRPRESQQDYQPDYRDNPEHSRYHPPPRDYYPREDFPREDYGQDYRREYPPRDPPLSERAYDYSLLGHNHMERVVSA